MAKSVLELAVGTGKWDAGLKKAKSALDNFTQANGGLQQALDKESQKMQQFVRMMGGMESTAKTAKGQMNDYKSTIEQLTMQYNRMSEAQKKVVGQDYLQAIEQMKQKYQSVNKEIQDMNRSLKNVEMPEMKGGGLFSGMGSKMEGALAVFGGNIMTKAAGAVANLGSEMADMVKQGVELAKQGEGIRIAFERLGRGDILDGLRESTHGTVTDLELMKAAVKFNDFKLPVEELGTMLAFAQQKAKDTGQSVDYMVDSIVTGLGRKSLMILDNLGLSAAEIKDKMKDTGDMTKAVGEIIREQMAKAGDYVETAADRAAQANVNLQNKMEELGRKFAPVEEASNQLWTSMKIGILDIIGGPLATLLNQLTEAGRLKNALNNLNGDGGSGNTVVGGKLKQLQAAKNSGASQYVLNFMQSSTVEGYNRQITKANELLKQFEKNHSSVNVVLQNATKQFGQKFSSISELEAFRDAYKVMIADYRKGASEIMKPVKVDIQTDNAIKSVDELKVKLAELQAQRKKVKAGSDEAKRLDTEIRQVKADIKLQNPNALKTTHTTTPQEKAAEMVANAERTYAETLQKSAIRMEAGLDSTLDNKKKELSAKERLFDAYNDAYATYKDPKYKEASAAAAEKIKQLAAEVKTATDAQEAAKKSARELESAQKKLADAQQKLADAQATGSATAVYKAQKDVDKQQEAVNRLQNPTLPQPAKPTGFEALKQSVQAEIKFDQMQVDENTLHTLLQTALKNGLEGLTVDYGGLQQKISQGIDIPESTWQELQDEINEKLKELELEPIKIDFNTGGIKKVNDETKKLVKAANTTANVVGSIGEAFNAIEDPAAKVAGTVAQAIANIAMAYSDALAKDQTTKFNIWGFIAAAAASTISMATTIAAIHSQTGYAEGGIVKGNHYSGDMLDGGSFGINAGELVLNRAQQGSLASQLEGSAGGFRNGQIVGRIEGEKIVLVANRYFRRTGQGEILTWK